MNDTEQLREQVKQYVEHADKKSLKMVQAILEIDETDWWDELPYEVQKMLDVAIRQGEEGQGTAHEQMVEKYSKWFRK